MSEPTADRPWEVGDEEARWNGYLDFSRIDYEVGMPVLRNLVNASSFAELRQREDHFAAIRRATMREYGIPGSYDLDGLRAIHGHLFQDVYEWAGQVRTVNIVKGSGAFAAPESVAPMMAAVAESVQSTDRLRTVPSREFPAVMADIYNAVNTAHPFREGNGRTQREFVNSLAAESWRGLDWTKVHGPLNDYASEQARQGNLAPMTTMFEVIAYELPEREALHAMEASRPPRSASASTPSEARHAAFPHPKGSTPSERERSPGTSRSERPKHLRIPPGSQRPELGR